MRKKISLMLVGATFLLCAGSLKASLKKDNLVGVEFDQTAFTSKVETDMASPVMYLGGAAAAAVGATDAQKAHALSRAQRGVAVDGKAEVQIMPVAPANVALGGVAAQANPLNAQKINSLALLDGTYPVVVQGGDVTKAYLVTKPFDGTAVIPSAVIKDTGDSVAPVAAADTKEVVALAASDQYVFGAVSKTGVTWQDPAGTYRGVAVLKKDAAVLTQLDPTNFAAVAGNEKAVKVDVLAVKHDAVIPPLVAFFEDAAGNPIARAELGAGVDMHWDSKLERLYVGLTNVRRDQGNKEGGVFNVFMGRIKQVVGVDNALVLSPIVPTDYQTDAAPAVAKSAKDLLYAVGSENSNKLIFGCYYDGLVANNGQLQPALSAGPIRTMHTSTGKNYLVLRSTIDERAGKYPGNGTYRGVYALPLLSEDFKATKFIKGQISKATFDGAPMAFADMPTADDPATKVGFGVGGIDTNEIKDMFVEGDTVYACVGGKTVSEAGVFASSAIFNTAGAVQSWTPWQRMLGSGEKVYGGGIDQDTGRMYALTSKGRDDGAPPNADFDNINTVRVTDWGKSDSVADTADNRALSTMLEQIFPASIGGVHQLFTFDERTPGFVQGDFSMAVATSLGKVALIQTGRRRVGGFEPTREFVQDTNIFVKEGQAIQDLGPIYLAEVSRDSDAARVNNGYVFVGGTNGVAVLSLANGNGWVSHPNANSLGQLLPDGAGNDQFPGGTNWTFKKLVPADADAFDNPRKIACLGNYLYILTDKALYFATLDNVAAHIGGAALGEVKVTLPADVPDPVKREGWFTDFVPLHGDPSNGGYLRGALATTDGLYAIDGNSAAKAPATAVKIASVTNPAVGLTYVSSKRGEPSDKGNLFVLSGDLGQVPSEGALQRFVVSADQGVTAALADVVKEPGADDTLKELNLSEFRGNHMTDGSFIVHTRGKHFGDTEYVDLVPVAVSNTKVDMTSLLEVDTSTQSYIAAPLRDSASGALLLPGEWGVRVNE